MTDPNRATEVKVTGEKNPATMLFTIDEAKANEALLEMFPGMGKLKIKMTKNKEDFYGAYKIFTDGQTVEISPNSFVDILPNLEEVQDENAERRNESRTKLMGQRLLDIFEDAFSNYPRGYRPRDIVARDKQYFMQLIQQGIDHVEARKSTIQRKAAEVTTHEVEHINQSKDGKFGEVIKKGIKTASVGLGATIATTLTLILLSHSGQIPITPEQVNDFIYHPAFLAAGWGAALIPAYVTIRNSTRGIEKGAYDKAFEVGDKLVDAIQINEQMLDQAKSK